MIRRRALFAVLLAALFLAGWSAGRGQAAGRLYGHFDLLVEVLQAVRANYVDPVEPEKIVGGAMNGLLRDLDPYSEYLDAGQYQAARSSIEGAFDGIGAYVDVRDGYPSVIAPIEGTPAWEAGLLPGDLIVKVDGHPTWGLGLDAFAARLRGEPGSTVTLSVYRAGEADAHDMTLTRRRVVTHPVPYAFVVAPGVGYLRLASFSDRAADETRASLDSLRALGVRSLVLDLRGNPGGLVQRAVDVAGLFLPRGALVTRTQGRTRESEQRHDAAAAKPVLDWPLAVLVDGGSASAAEIVAGALQDHDRAVVLGSTSFGKGSVQSFLPLRGGGGALKLTTAHYLTPSGRSIHRSAAARGSHSEAEDDEETLDEEAPATPDSAPKAEFRTAAGRLVQGGGGITPDLSVSPDSLPPTAREVETHRLAFRFAEQWRREHGPTAPSMSEASTAFRRWLADQSRSVDEATWNRERAPIEEILGREVARRYQGERAAGRLMAAGDPVVQRAVRLLHRARAPRDVFVGLVASGK